MRVRDPVQVREMRMEKREETKLFSNTGLDILPIEPMLLLMKAIESLLAIIVCMFTEEILVTG